MVSVNLDKWGKWITSWTELDGYARSREFDFEMAALRYALQVECRLEIDAHNRELQSLAPTVRTQLPSVPANDDESREEGTNG